MSDRKWRKLEEREVFKTPYFSVNKNTFSDSLEFQDDFYVFNFTDWVNVVPETDSGEFVMIRIYRFGVEDYTLEFPGGQIDGGSNPLSAASMELLEETGFTAKDISPLGWVHPNPALQKNRAYFFHATGLSKPVSQSLDDAEDISPVFVHKSEIPDLIARGKITHALTLLAYYYSQTAIIDR